MPPPYPTPIFFYRGGKTKNLLLIKCSDLIALNIHFGESCRAQKREASTNHPISALSVQTTNSPFSCQLKDHFSIYTTELQAILFALKQACQSQESKFMIFSNLLSALQALDIFLTDLALLIQMQLQSTRYKN